MNNKGKNVSRKNQSGFTLMEIVIVIGVIMILTIIGIDVFYGSTDIDEATERKNDLTTIYNALERYYKTGSGSSEPSYPATTPDIGKKIEELVDDKEAVIAPGETSNSIAIEPYMGKHYREYHREKKYVYTSYNRDGSVCKKEPCVRYRLEYYIMYTYMHLDPETGEPANLEFTPQHYNIVDSMRQQ